MTFSPPARLNRAACHLKLENYEMVVEDATRVLEGDSGNVKALFGAPQAGGQGGF